MASIEALLGVLRASDYGARGGGNRDDAPGLIQALAIAAVAGGAAPLGEGQNLTGGIVTLDPGVLYRIGRTVNIPSNVELVIPTGALVRAAPGFVGAMFSATGAVGLRVTGGGLVDGNRAGGAQADPFVFTNCSDGNLDGPIVQGGNTDGVTLTGCTRMQIEIQSQANGRHGVYHSGSTFCGGTILARDNGQRVAGSGVAFDVASTDNSYQLVATDTRVGGAKTQQYGMFEVPASGCDRNVISASSLTGNALGTLSLVGGASGYIAGAPVAASVGDAQIAPGGLSNASLGASVARANLFVNGGFEIAQRPGAPWTGNGIFTLDYWRQDAFGAGASTVSTSQITSTIGSPGKSAQIVYTHVAGSGYRYEQPVRLGDNLDQLRGKQITFGFQVKSTVAGTVRCVANGTVLGIVNGAYNVGVAEETIQLTVNIPANETGLFLGVQFDVATATVEINDGRHALGAVLPNYAPVPAADDLARCLRYYQRWASNGSPIFATGQCYSTTQALMQLPLLAEMGGTPTLTVSATTDVGLQNANMTVNTACSAVSVYSVTVNALAVILNVTVNAANQLVGNATMLAFRGAAAWLALEWNPA